MPGLVRIAGVGTDKVESAARLTRVVDRDLDFLAGSESARQSDPQLAVGGLEAGRLSAGSDCADLEFGGVEFEALERPGDRRQPMRRGAGNFFRVEVERDFELDVIDAGGAIARPFCLDVLRLKRAASAREGDAKGLAVAQLHRQLIEKSRLVHGRDVMNRGARAQSGSESGQRET